MNKTMVKSAAALPLNTILGGDCIDVMNSLPAESVDLIFADPPYRKDRIAPLMNSDGLRCALEAGGWLILEMAAEESPDPVAR